MNAQEKWKAEYRRAQQDKALERYSEAKEHLLHVMSYRREAALERKLEAAQRKIEALETTLKDIATAPYEDQPNDGNEWEKEYYLRGMHR